jgi:class 3 adenylate cyclase/tetratricopeptide (TPR) repeat protein
VTICPSCGEDNPDKAKFCLECATALKGRVAPAQEARKTVTILFCDLVGSTSLGERLDSESLREVMDRYFAAMRGAIERHGGTVEKFIGDAVMAAFGLPRVHEDDALRAVRAADEMRYAVSALNTELERHWGVAVSNRIGVNTGEVVVGDPSSGQRLATGDAVNVAARLEQAAPSGGVLVGESTHRLVRDAVISEPVEPLTVKGKSQALAAFRLLQVKPAVEGVSRRLDAPLVGRDEEMAALMEAFDRSIRPRRCEIVLLTGDAGVGKSRLIGETRAVLGQRARLVAGRCLSYGEGIAFWPLRDIVFELAGAAEDASTGEIEHALCELAADPHTVERVAAAVGLTAGSFPPEETAWAVRSLLETAARPRPLVVIVEDLHWGEAALLAVLGHVVESMAAAPILLLCSARPEFLDENREWVDGLPRVTVEALQPLSQSATTKLVANLLDGAAVAPETVQRITDAAAGNPLYVEQIASMWLDEGVLKRADGRWQLAESKLSEEIPPTISALLAARLDRLSPEERAVAAAASVMGQFFYRGAVESLSPDGTAVGAHLATLNRKGFVRRDDSVFFEEEVFSFRHGLIRDTAYAGILKRTRAEMHERFANWLERKAGARRDQYDEILGYHLYEAYRYREQLGIVGDVERALGARAAVYLASAGRRALNRQDVTATTLLERATRLFPVGDPDVPDLMIEMGEALRRSEKMKRAEAVFAEGVSLARAAGNAQAEAKGTLYLLNLRVDEGHLSPEALNAALAELEQRVGPLRDSHTAAHAAALVGGLYIRKGALERAREQWLLAVDQADRSESAYVQNETRVGTLLASLWGPDHVDDVIARAHEYLRRAEQTGALRLQAVALVVLVMGETMRGRSDEAEPFQEQLSVLKARLGVSAVAGEALSTVEPDLLLLRGDWDKAETLIAPLVETLERMEVPSLMPVTLTQMGEVFYYQGRISQAETLARRAQPLISNEVECEIRVRKLLGKCLARLGLGGEAVAREAADIGRPTDMINLTGDALCDLAEVLTLEGPEGRRIREPLEEALALYERKGNLFSAAKGRSWLERL